MVSAFNRLDMFGTPIKFNFDGKELIKSTPGALVTILIGFVSLAFMSQRF